MAERTGGGVFAYGELCHLIPGEGGRRVYSVGSESLAYMGCDGQF